MRVRSASDVVAGLLSSVEFGVLVAHTSAGAIRLESFAWDKQSDQRLFT